MTIEREGRNGPFVISCDECGETYECMGEDFANALADAKDEGYKSYRNATNSGYEHYCRDCDTQ